MVNIPPEKKTEGRTADSGTRRAIEKNKPHPNEVFSNLRAARSIWGPLPRLVLNNLRELTKKHHLSVRGGDVALLDGQLYVTHAGLLRIGERSRCSGIVTLFASGLSNPTVARWVFKAIVYRRIERRVRRLRRCRSLQTFPLWSTGPRCVSPKLGPSTALYAKPMESVSARSRNWVHSHPSVPPLPEGKAAHPPNGNGSANGQPRLRDKLCLLIRKYELDPNLVKRYAADFCGTETLRDAGRDLVEAFVSTVAEEAAKDRSALICKLNSYSQPEEVKS